jgi:hypothetical protein
MTLFWRIFELILRKDLIRDTAVCSSSSQDVFKREADAKLFDKREFHSALPGSTGAEHCAVDIKKQDVL